MACCFISLSRRKDASGIVSKLTYSTNLQLSLPVGIQSIKTQ
jgi:hypothetical protein